MPRVIILLLAHNIDFPSQQKTELKHTFLGLKKTLLYIHMP